MQKELLKKVAKLHPGDVMYPFDIIQEKLGFDAVCIIAELFGSLTVYVPSLRKIFAQCLWNEARKEFDGENFHELAIKYGFSERHLRRLLYAC